MKFSYISKYKLCIHENVSQNEYRLRNGGHFVHGEMSLYINGYTVSGNSTTLLIIHAFRESIFFGIAPPVLGHFQMFLKNMDKVLNSLFDAASNFNTVT